VLERLNAEIQAVLSQLPTRERLSASECLPLKTSVAEFNRNVAQDFEAMGHIVKAARIVGES
jgi:hypothetical protein